MNETEMLTRRLQREKNARQQAEALLEKKSLELYQANQALLKANSDLEKRVNERTAELCEANAQLQRDILVRQRTEKSLIAKELEARLLHQATTMAAETHSFETAMQQCLALVCEATGWALGHAYIIDEESHTRLNPTGIWHLNTIQSIAAFRELTDQTPLAIGVGLPGRVLATGEPAWIADVRSDKNFARSAALGEVNLRGAFAFPIKVAGQCVAVLEFFREEEAAENQNFLQIMQSVGEQLGRVLERNRAHQTVISVSRQAGMAEVATGVLHNVGNVLNSVNVSATLVADRLRRLEIANLARAAALMQEHAGDLAAFLTTDARGKHMTAYLLEVAEHFSREQAGLIEELTSLEQSVEHIKQVVSMQQSHARVVGVTQLVAPAELLDEALRLHNAALTRHHVQLQRDYAPMPPITVDKHKALQILVDVISNAKNALEANDPVNRRLTLRTRLSDEQPARLPEIQVIDNGNGISADNLTKIFSHGFTTRRDGHGFGLHSAALAARELGGTLQVSSDGPGTGASFTLELPVAVETKAALAAGAA